jgi:hypothetical protein
MSGRQKVNYGWLYLNLQDASYFAFYEDYKFIIRYYGY